MRRVDSLEKTVMLGGIGGRRRRGWQEEMAGWHHRLDGCEFEWTPGVGVGQGGLACCNSWGRKESDMTERLNWTDVSFFKFLKLFSTKHLFYVGIWPINNVVIVSSGLFGTYSGSWMQKHLQIVERLCCEPNLLWNIIFTRCKCIILCAWLTTFLSIVTK